MDPQASHTIPYEQVEDASYEEIRLKTGYRNLEINGLSISRIIFGVGAIYTYAEAAGTGVYILIDVELADEMMILIMRAKGTP